MIRIPAPSGAPAHAEKEDPVHDLQATAPPDPAREVEQPGTRRATSVASRGADRGTILVLWTGYPAGPVVHRSLSRAGFRALGAHPRGRGGRSPSCPRPDRYPAPRDEPDAFLGWLAGVVAAMGVDAVLPLDEDIVRLLAERGPEVPGLTVVGPTREQYRSLCDKLTLTRTAASLGIDSPHTVEVGDDGPTGSWPALPSIVKPATSVSGGAAAGLVRSAAERDELVGRMLAQGITPLVQEQVVGPRWVVHSVRGPGVFEHLTHRVGLEWPRGAGLASVKIVETTPAPVLRAALALLDEADYRGPSGISLLERDGRYHVHDVNLRLGATARASVHAGFDFPRRAVEAALELGGRPFEGRARRGRYMRLDLEVMALREAISTRRSGGDPAGVLRGIAAVAADRRGRLDPSPLDPFGIWPPVASALLRGALGRRSAGPTARDSAPPTIGDRP